MTEWRKGLELSFSASALWTLGQDNSWPWGHPVPRGVMRSPHLRPPLPPDQVTETRNVSRHSQISPGRQNRPVEIHPPGGRVFGKREQST